MSAHVFLHPSLCPRNIMTMSKRASLALESEARRDNRAAQPRASHAKGGVAAGVRPTLLRRLSIWLAPLVMAGAVQAAPAPAEGGAVRIALRGDPATLDCHGISSAHVAFVLMPAYSTLLKFDPENYPAVV